MIPYDLLLYMQLSAGLAWTDEGTGMLNMIAPDKLVSVTRQKEDVMWTNKHGFKHSFAFNLKTKAKGGKLYVRPPQLRISINLLISGTGTILYLIFYHIRVLFKMYSFIGVFLAEHQGFEGPDPVHDSGSCYRTECRGPRGVFILPENPVLAGSRFHVVSVLRARADLLLRVRAHASSVAGRPRARHRAARWDGKYNSGPCIYAPEYPIILRCILA